MQKCSLKALSHNIYLESPSPSSRRYLNHTQHFRHCDIHTNLTMSTAELATSYAALILADDGVDITVRAHTKTSALEYSLCANESERCRPTNSKL